MKLRPEQFSLLLVLGSLLLFSSSLANAQVTTADLVGTIKDTSGGIVPGVTVELTNEATGVTRSATTGNGGTYVFTSLQPGRYKLTAEIQGFRKVERTGVELQVNQRAQIDLELEVGLVSETVLIEGTAPLLETQSSVLGSVIEEKQVQDLPLNGRNFVQLATLATGVSGAGSGMRGTIMSGTRPDDLRPGTELFVNGNRENSNNYLYDGIDNNTRLTLVTVMRPNVEAIKEFKVQTNLYSADQGRNPGGQINVVTKSGSNALNGTVYEFLRNARFDANNFFANRAGQPKPPFEQNQFGGAIGGPIIANKTFFFADYDGFRQKLGRVFVNTVPTLKMRQGDFTEVGTIYDPLTTVAGPGGTVTRQPFPGNVVPRDRWDPVTAKLINAYPVPTTSALVNNLVTTPSRTQDWNQFDVRIDHTQSERNNFLARYSWSKTSTINPYTFAPVQLPGLSKAVGLGNEDTFAGPSDLLAEHAVFGWVHVFSSRLLLDSRGGYNHFNLDFTQADAVPGDQLGEQLGVPNANQQVGQDGIPIFSPANYTGIGHSRSLPIFRHERAFQFVTNLTFAGDKHTIKTGFDVRRRHMGEFQTNRGNGRFNFSPNITNNPANNTGGHVMASFLLGAPSQIEQDYLLADDVGMRSTEYSVYVGDDWRTTERLTLNLGMRYELDTPFTEVDNLWANFDPTTATVLVAGRNGVSRTAGVKTFKKAFAPRLGFAYQIAQHTVVRGGAGLFWNTPGNGGAALRLHRHVPFGPIYSFNPGTQFVTRRVSDGFPTIPPMNVALADNPSGSVIGVDPNYQPGYAEQFNLTVEHELPWALLLKTSYVGNIGKHLDTTFNLNQPVPGPGGVNERRPFFGVRPALADVNWAVSDGLASYHALQFSAQKRLTHGLNGLLSYTWGHSIDTVGQAFGGGAEGPLPQDPRNRLASRGSSPFDIRHRLTIAWNYALPFGEGQKWLNNSGPAQYVFGGWQVNGINTFQTGLPFTPTLSAPTTGGTASRPDRIADGKLSDPTVDRWFDTSAFTTPAPFTYGNAGRNILYGPGRVNVDFSLFKEFRLKQDSRLQFRVECFNLLNTPQFDLPNASIGASNAGTITAIVGTPRQIQLGAKVVF